MRLRYVGLDLAQFIFNRRHRLESHAEARLKACTSRAIIVNQQRPSLLLLLLAPDKDLLSLYTRAPFPGRTEAGDNSQDLGLLMANLRAQIPRAGQNRFHLRSVGRAVAGEENQH